MSNTTATDYRALCAELLDEVAARPLILDRELIARARAALAEPVAEGPTDEEIDAWITECADATRHGPLDHYWAFDVEFDYVRDITRAALARWGNYPAQSDGSPAPPAEGEVAEGPTDEELLGLMPQQLRDDLATVSRMAAHGAGPDVTPGLFEASLTAGALQFARAVLAHRGHQPAPPTEGEVADPAGPTDDELWDIGERHLWTGTDESVTNYRILTSFIEAARVVVARYGHQPASPVAEGEVADLIAWLGDEADQYDCIQQAPETAHRLRCAADLLAQRHPAPVPGGAVNPWKDALIDALVCNFLLNKENESDPRKALHDLISWETRLARDPSINPLMRPVPVSERLPGPEDCDAEGLCWVWHTTAYTWGLFRLDLTAHSHWLPATALPLPAAEVQP